MRAILWVVAVCLWVLGCAVEEAAPRCELGRSTACVCSSGAAGAQECGPFGAWSACACAAPADAGSDAAVVVDAPGPSACPRVGEPCACRVDGGLVAGACVSTAGRLSCDCSDGTDAATPTRDAAADAQADVAPDGEPRCTPSTLTYCGVEPVSPGCWNLNTSNGQIPALNCGACGRACPSAAPECVGGRCTAVADAGR